MPILAFKNTIRTSHVVWVDKMVIIKHTLYLKTVDQFQSLIVALYMIGVGISTSDYHKEGRLRDYDSEKGYGFPVIGIIRELLFSSDREGT